jgi:antibiotic biosynthesis monooxygenase (ABM) superfamily enzyme
MAADRTMPTVVVARVPVPGREQEFERWLRRLVAAARQAPGHVHSDIQPPDSVHPGEWVILYQFTDADSLSAWLTSETRDAIVADGRELVAGNAREQVVALAHQPEPVTAVASFRLAPGNQARYAEFHRLLVDRLTTFPGFLRCEAFPPIPGVQDETVVVLAFDSRQHLDDWLESDARQRTLAEIDPYLEGDRTINVVGGFAGWFGRPGMARVKTWKQASVVLLGILPISLAITAIRRWLAPDMNWVLGVVVGNVLGVIALSWLLMPWLTRLFAGWLRS